MGLLFLFRLLPLRRLRGDSVADRIREALQTSSDGLARKQIRKLFHGHVSSASIDQALEKLSSLGLVTSRYDFGRGRPTTPLDRHRWPSRERRRKKPTNPKNSRRSRLSTLTRLARTF